MSPFAPQQCGNLAHSYGAKGDKPDAKLREKFVGILQRNAFWSSTTLLNSHNLSEAIIMKRSILDFGKSVGASMVRGCLAFFLGEQQNGLYREGEAPADPMSSSAGASFSHPNQRQVDFGVHLDANEQSSSKHVDYFGSKPIPLSLGPLTIRSCRFVDVKIIGIQGRDFIDKSKVAMFRIAKNGVGRTSNALPDGYRIEFDE